MPTTLSAAIAGEPLANDDGGDDDDVVDDDEGDDLLHMNNDFALHNRLQPLAIIQSELFVDCGGCGVQPPGANDDEIIDDFKPDATKKD